MIHSEWACVYDQVRIDNMGVGRGVVSICRGNCLEIHLLAGRKVITMKMKVLDISCGMNHALILDEDSKVYSIGSNRALQCGAAEAILDVPQLREVFSGATQVFCGARCSFLIGTSGSLLGFGSNLNGELGFPRETKTIQCPTIIPGIPHRVDNISSGFGHTCVVSSGIVFACGSNSHGQLSFCTHSIWQEGFTRVDLPIPIEKVACGTWCTGLLTAGGEILVAGKPPPYQEGPIPLTKILANRKIRLSNKPDPGLLICGMRRIDLEDDFVDLVIGTNFLLALREGRRHLVLVDLDSMQVLKEWKTGKDVTRLSAEGSSWAFC